MRRKQTLLNLLDNVEHNPDMFRSLRRVVPLRGADGALRLDSHNRYHRLAVTIDNEPFSLYFPFNWFDEEHMEMVARCRATRTIGSRLLAKADFLPDELRVEDSDGCLARVDVVIENGNHSLRDEVTKCARKGRVAEIRGWLKRLAEFAARIVDSDVKATLPSADNIVIDPYGKLHLRAYPFYAKASMNSCYKTLLSSALAIYLLGSSPVAMLHLSPRLLLPPQLLTPLSERLDRRIPAQRRVADIADALLADELTATALLSHLYLLTILPFEKSVGLPLSDHLDPSALSGYEAYLLEM